MHLLNDETMQAICWTLIHSLWQGLLLAVLAGLVIMLTKKSTSDLRYNLLSGLFFLFVAATCITFLKQYNFASRNSDLGHVQLIRNAGQNTNVNTYPVNDVVTERTYFETFTNYFNEHASLIVMIWFVVLSAQCIRLIANAGYVQRIKHYKTHAPPAYWNERMSFLAKKLQIKQRVKLLQSEMVKVPVMVGFLKPVILFPFQLMSQLPAKQVEAVLLHELAHIKRKDYFVNMLQNFAEIIFFFNPGVLWISSLIKEERENCCDDIAIGETKQKNEFVHALVSFQEYNLAGSKYSLAFPGRKNHLLNRVKRILTDNNKTLNNMEKISLATGIVVIGLITIAFKQTVKQNTVKEQSAVKILQAKKIKNDTVPDKPEISTFSFNGNIDGKKYKIKEINGKVVELYVEGSKISNDKIGDYQAIIDKLHVDAKKQQDELQVQNAILEKQRAEMIEEQEHVRKEQDEIREQHNKAIGPEDVEKMKIEQQELNASIRKLVKERETVALKSQLEEQNNELLGVSNALRKRNDELQEQTRLLQQKNYKQRDELLNKQLLELKDEQLHIQMERLEINKMLLDRQQNISVNPEIRIDHDPVTISVDEPVVISDIDAVPPAPPVLDSKPIPDIIEDLIEEKIIMSRDNLSFTLNNEILKVNGVIQSKELHEKLKDKYIKGKKDHVIYSKHGGSTHTEVITHNG